MSGKGLKAAMNVALIVGTLRTLAEFDSSPAAMLNGLNRRLVGRLQGGFATTVVLKLSPSGDYTLANAVHLPPFLNSGEMSLEPSLPLGIDPDSDYTTGTSCFTTKTASRSAPTACSKPRIQRASCTDSTG